LEGPGFRLYYRVDEHDSGTFAKIARIEPTDYFDNPGDYVWMEFVSLLDHARYELLLRGHIIASGIRTFRFRAPRPSGNGRSLDLYIFLTFIVYVTAALRASPLNKMKTIPAAM
jgi:hypothetical protein